MIQAALDALVQRAEGAGGAPGLADAVPDLKSVRTWEGPWDAMLSPQRLSVRTPAALVSLVDLVVVDVGRTLAGVGRLAPSSAEGGRAVDERPRPTCRLEVAVTILAAESGAKQRAAAVLELAEQAIPVMVDHALEGIYGTNLDSDKLRQKGISAFTLVGYREVELRAAEVERELPSRVDAQGAINGQVYPAPEC